MKLAVVSHKPCWASSNSPTGYATDGGFPMQMQALSDLFDETALIVPCSAKSDSDGEIPLTGHNLSIVPLTPPHGRGLWRKMGMVRWFVTNGPLLWNAMRPADAVHAPIPGDLGTIGMLLACVMRKPLFVRHCGNWFVQTTIAEHFWKWFMERFAGGRNVMLATGGAAVAPSPRNPNLRWIFSTSLTAQELMTRTRREAKEDDDHRVRLIIVCRQDEKKGAGIVIESLPLILNAFPQATLDVVGGGRALGKFKTLVTKLNLTERVCFHGKVNHKEVMRLLHQADVFCYPTMASEGFPKVVLEALAHGLPVVATRVSVLTTLIGENGCGVLLQRAAPAEVAAAIKEILTDREEFRAMSARAVRTARQYSIERWRDTIGDQLGAAWGRPLRSII